MLSNFACLGITGGAIKMDGRVVAFALGENLNPETMVVHVEKAYCRHRSARNQLINNEFWDSRGPRPEIRQQRAGL